MTNTINITPIIEIVISVFAVIISTYFLPKLAVFLKSKLNEEQLKQLTEWVRVAVAAAEQMFNESGLGEQKKEYVVNFIRSKGLEIDYKEIEALIESEVYKLTQGSGYLHTEPDEPTDADDTEDINYNTIDEETAECDTEVTDVGNMFEAVG